MTNTRKKPAGPRKALKKNIILCSDGTGNRGGKGNGTNVWRIYNCVDLNSHKDKSAKKQKQISFYEDGVGTEDFKPFKLFGGAFGWGLGRNIQDLYDFLIKNYNQGDDIYLFGFSRGAFTVRSLAGLIEQCGIPERRSDSALMKEIVNKAYRAYKNTHKKKKTTRLMNMFISHPEKYLSDHKHQEYLEDARTFKKDYSEENIKIHFIGVWDTVSAVGMPFDFLRVTLDWLWNTEFHDYQLGPSVENACHALSIDDERLTFHPQLWDENGIPSNTKLEQVWFSGVHSNVGGGYPKQGMSYVPLHWMMSKAKKRGLHFKTDALEDARQAADVNDKMYDSRAGTGIYYRYWPREIAKICEKSNLGKPKIHASVFDRIKTGVQNYAPGFIPADIEVVTTHDKTNGAEHTPEELATYADRIRSLAAESNAALKDALNWIRPRRTLYYSFVTFNILLVTELSLFSSEHSIDGANSVGTSEIFNASFFGFVPEWLSSVGIILIDYFIARPVFATVLFLAPALMLLAHKIFKDKINRILTAYWWETTSVFMPSPHADVHLLGKGTEKSAGKKTIRRTNKKDSKKPAKDINR